MVKMTLKIDGMSCSMCEAHVNNTIRSAFSVKKVNSAHRKGITEIIAEEEIPEEALRAAIAETGYRILGIESVPYEKKGFFRK